MKKRGKKPGLKGPRNLVGPQIRRLGYQQRLTQRMFAARCRRWGWEVSRETPAKIEAQFRWLSDFEMLRHAKGLRATPEDLWPAKERIPRLLETFFERLSPSIEWRPHADHSRNSLFFAILTLPCIWR
jgi:hypothetical protein